MCLFFCFPHQINAGELAKKLNGRILLQVESSGEAWYVYPNNNQRYYLGRPADAIKIMRQLGLGVSNKDITNFNGRAPKRLNGKILLQVEDKGQAYYVNPVDSVMHYLGRPADALRVMRLLGLGIKNENLEKIVPASIQQRDIIIDQEIADKNVVLDKKNSNATDLEWQIHILINNERLAMGVPALKWSNTIAQIARAHSQDMATKNYLDHEDLEGCDENCRLAKNNYQNEYVIEYLGAEYNYKLIYPNGVVAQYKTAAEIARDVVKEWEEYEYMFSSRLIYEGIGTAESEDKLIYITSKMVLPVVTAEQEKELKEFIATFVNPEDDTLVKIKKIYGWITMNIDYDVAGYLADPRPIESYAAWQVFANKKGICQGYSNLFALMLRYVGVSAEVISGIADGDRHSWSKIAAEGEDLYFDTTWDVGYVENEKFTKNITNNYYLLPKKCLFVSHVEAGEKEMTKEEQKTYVKENISLFDARCPSLRDIILYQ